MRTPPRDLVKLGPTTALLGAGSLVAWAGLLTTLANGGYPGAAAQAEYWAHAGFLAFGALIMTAIVGLMVWVILDDPTTRTDA